MILEAYTFLCHNRGTEEDEIILLGFSRGAFAMRCLADFIIKYGILPKGQLEALQSKFAEWKAWRLSSGDFSNDNASNDNIPKDDASKDHASKEGKVKIKVCALWDTVPTMGLGNPILPGFYPFVDSQLDRNIENAFQALSLHEHRLHFSPLVWERGENNESKLEQCWFSGYHGDVGGGDNEGPLAHFALAWLITKLMDFISINDMGLWDRVPAIQAWDGAPGGEYILPVETTCQSRQPHS